jgi:hypothetical protein
MNAYNTPRVIMSVIECVSQHVQNKYDALSPASASNIISKRNISGYTTHCSINKQSQKCFYNLAPNIAHSRFDWRSHMVAYYEKSSCRKKVGPT